MTPTERTLKGWGSRGRPHNLSEHPLYETWGNMIRRCYNQNNPNYKYYGARGIEVCGEWKKSPIKYIEYVLGLGWSIDYSLDRINNNGNYEPANLRLATNKTQANNTSRNRLLTYNNETHTMAEWADILRIPYGRLQTRIQRGWSVARALTSSNIGWLRLSNDALLGTSPDTGESPPILPEVEATN